MRKFVWGEDPEMSGPRNYFRESLMISALNAFSKNSKILDAGCGTGSLSIRLGKLKYHVTSIDSSSLSIAFLKNRLKKLDLLKYLIAIKGNIFKLPFPNNSFHGVVCGEVLEHLSNDKRAIKELFRVVKKNGVIIVTVPAHPEMWDLSDDISGHKRRYTKEELQRKFESSGFNVFVCFYWGFPLNNLWHKNIFIPYLVSKMKKSKQTRPKSTFFTNMAKYNFMQKIFSFVFYFDFLFNFTQKGNSLLLIAKKP